MFSTNWYFNFDGIGVFVMGSVVIVGLIDTKTDVATPISIFWGLL